MAVEGALVQLTMYSVYSIALGCDFALLHFKCRLVLH